MTFEALQGVRPQTLGNWCHGSVTSTIKKCSLILGWALLCASLGPLPFVLSTEKSLAPSSMHQCIRYSYTLVRFSPKPPLFQAEESQPSQPPPMGQVLLYPDHLGGPLSWTPSSSSISLLNRGTHNWPQYCRCHLASAEWSKRISRPAGETLPTTAQGMVGLLYSKGPSLPHVQLGVHQDFQVLLCRAA